MIPENPKKGAEFTTPPPSWKFLDCLFFVFLPLKGRKPDGSSPGNDGGPKKKHEESEFPTGETP